MPFVPLQRSYTRNRMRCVFLFETTKEMTGIVLISPTTTTTSSEIPLSSCPFDIFTIVRRTLWFLIFVAAVLMFFSGLEARGLPFPPPISQNHIRCASSFVVAFIAFLSKKINISITGADFDTYIASFATWFSLHQCCFYGFLIEYRHWRHCRLEIPILYNSG